jgi:tyrosine-protein kinase Etk/Wzc
MTHPDHPTQPNPPLRRFHDRSEDIDLRHYFGIFLSNWYWFAASLFIAVTIAYGINKYSEKLYTVSASLLISSEQGGSDMTGVDKIIPGGNFFNTQQNLENEIGILKSFSLNYQVMKDLKEFHITIIEKGRRGIAQRRHYKSEPFIIVYDSLNYQTLGVPLNMKILPNEKYSLDIGNYRLSKKEYSFGEKFHEAGFDFTVKLRDSLNYKYDPDYPSRFIFWFNNPADLANEYRGKLVVTPLKENSSMVTLSVSGKVPWQEAEYLNKLMDEYRQQGLEYKNQTAEKTMVFIDQQLDTILASLSKAETAMEKFRLTNRLIDLSSEGLNIKEKLNTYSNEKTSVSLQKKYFEYLADYLKTKNESGEIISPSIMGITDPLLIKLVNDLASLQIEKKKLNYAISKDQPLIGFAESGIEDARKALSENIKNNLLNTERLMADIDSRISGVEKELDKLPATERGFIRIQRNYELNNTVYTYMLEKRSEASIAKASKVSGNRVIDEANAYNAVMIKPTPKKNYLFALALGLLIPGLYIYLIDRFHNKILDKKDIEAGTQVPIIGFVGHNTTKDEIPIVTRPGTSLSESFRSIRTNMKYYMNGESKVVISITSTISGEGKTFISVNLAAALSMLGKKTLMIGMDLRKPKLDRIFDADRTAGLSTYLIGQTSFEDLIKKTDIENLYYVPSGPVPPNPTELLETENMRLFIDRVKKDFDFVVLDTPPVGIVSDALLLGSFADINMFIIRQRYSFKNTLEYIQNIYIRKEMKNLSIVVNDIHISGYYGYGLRYGYGFYEGYGYNYGYGQYGSYGRGDYHKYYTND